MKGNSDEVIAIAGKGGVGKTAVSAIATKLLRNKVNLLVIDADPVVSLAFALGENPSTTIGDYREKIIEFPEEKKKVSGQAIKKVIESLIHESKNGFGLLVMGRAEGPGCFCSLNELLRYGIEQVSRNYNITLVDCEAGIEQVNRRALYKIDKLLLIADTSMRAIETTIRVKEIAEKHAQSDSLESYVIVNRVKSYNDKAHLNEIITALGLNLGGFLPEDRNIQEYNLSGKPLIDLPEDSPSVLGVGRILKRLNII